MGRRKLNFDTHYAVDANGCWIWKGGVDCDGYGKSSNNLKVHRAYFERFVGPIPAGLCVCHRCDVRNCVNPAHLFLGTQAENVADKVSKGRQPRGTAVRHLAKLNDSIVAEILASDEPCYVLAEKYGVSDTAVSYVRLGKTWKHVPRPHGYSYVPRRANRDERGVFVCA